MLIYNFGPLRLAPSIGLRENHKYQLLTICMTRYIISKGRPTFILRDTNLDVLRPNETGVTAYMQLLSNLSLSQLITAPTHPGPNPTLIDHIIRNHPDLTRSAQVSTCSIRDHDLITVSVNGVKTRHQPTTFTVRSTRGLNQDALCLDLLVADWSALYQTTTPAEKWSAWRAVCRGEKEVLLVNPGRCKKGFGIYSMRHNLPLKNKWKIEKQLTSVCALLCITSNA